MCTPALKNDGFLILFFREEICGAGDAALPPQVGAAVQGRVYRGEAGPGLYPADEIQQADQPQVDQEKLAGVLGKPITVPEAHVEINDHLKLTYLHAEL